MILETNIDKDMRRKNQDQIVQKPTEKTSER